jgi:exodeoxyribonuclease V alpha subunit
VIASVEMLLRAGWAGPLERCFAEAMSRVADESDPLVLLGALVASRFTSHKHVCVDLSRLAERSVEGFEGEAVADLEWPVLRDWHAALEKSPLVSDGGTRTPLVVAGDRLYLYRYWDYERRLATRLERRAAASASDVDEALFEQGLVRYFAPGSEADLQRAAASVAVRRHLSVISGGPGTGKTTAVSRLLLMIGEQATAKERELPRVLLLAPTGKAAARLLESIREARRVMADEGTTGDAALNVFPDEASTIHRALGYRPDRPTSFRHDADSPLPADVVVVDEASMVDLALMTKLVEAIPREARLILLGDRDQLASVDAGSVLGDICGAGRLPGGADAEPGLGECVVHLTHSFRFDAQSAIGRLARAINENRPDRAIDLFRDEEGAPGLQLVDEGDPVKVESEIASLAADRYRRVVEEPQPLDRLRRLQAFRVLCAHRRGPGGAERVGAAIERTLAEIGAIGTTEGWYDGRPVLITGNDYQLGLWNGDTGLACTDPTTGRLQVVFPTADEGQRSVAPSRLAAFETVFATTVHKAQGSEFDEVAVVLPPRVSPVVTRELLYTAVTRARERVTIFGSAEVVAAAIRARTARLSGLRDLLWGPR